MERYLSTTLYGWTWCMGLDDKRKITIPGSLPATWILHVAYMKSGIKWYTAKVTESMYIYWTVMLIPPMTSSVMLSERPFAFIQVCTWCHWYICKFISLYFVPSCSVDLWNDAECSIVQPPFCPQRRCPNSDVVHDVMGVVHSAWRTISGCVVAIFPEIIHIGELKSSL